MPHPVSALPADVASDDVRQRLDAAGLGTVEALAQAGPGGIATATGLDADLSGTLHRAAQAWIDGLPPAEVVQLAHRDDEGSSRTVGLRLARRIQSTAERIHQARLRTRTASGGGRKKCRRQLERLLALLEDIEQDALRGTASAPFLEDARRILDDIEDRLDKALARKRFKPHHVKRLRKDARHLRHRVEALLGVGGEVDDDRAVGG